MLMIIGIILENNKDLKNIRYKKEKEKAPDNLSEGVELHKATVMPAVKEERPTVSLSVGLMSQYIWRGQELNHDSMVMESSMTIGYKGFTYNMWGNMDTNRHTGDTKNKWTETDTTIGTQLSKFKLNGGYIYYALDSVDNSQEIFLSAGLDMLLSPTITALQGIRTLSKLVYHGGCLPLHPGVPRDHIEPWRPGKLSDIRGHRRLFEGGLPVQGNRSLYR
ncbi:MAG: hypothetical protein ACUVQ2_05045 [Dissulfurimicrobium sp.]|uniref:hypothetical protein n=1 Tax=Dissulfurimicrobium sp. TaxID=2022436 RepID=UPI004049372F